MAGSEGSDFIKRGTQALGGPLGTPPESILNFVAWVAGMVF